MSINVQSISKYFGKQAAVDNISFIANKGEVLGFLGPNGAGKSTTMKMITGYLDPSEGEISVCGYSNREQPIEIQQLVGYLPENNPLYADMYVKEYLHYAAGFYKVSNVSKRVSELIDRTGLGKESHKQIGQLSKGYRQRVGLAQAMIHDPEVLILDEPTSGLDPNQLAEIRGLISELGKEKTVVFSTHIMQEVQAICDRVLIINEGKLVADDSIESLSIRIGGGQSIVVEFDKEPNEVMLNSIIGVTNTEKIGRCEYRFYFKEAKDIRSEVFHFAVKQGLTLLEMRKEEKSVEDIFQQLTRHQ